MDVLYPCNYPKTYPHHDLEKCWYGVFYAFRRAWQMIRDDRAIQIHESGQLYDPDRTHAMRTNTEG